ncbi:beta-galactosidase 12-like isoform X2 [Panicum virgatum]|uniref:beta-galactosidase 12-like isoform X2 n=1 Tax=Panicum virgatum TaxID=38727 RepID=UPI0019D57275|nr:beta-galactosidase 12-like isoform X2 [Panicum virgatum]
MTAVRAAAVLVAAAALAILLPGWAAAAWTLTKKGTIVTYDARSLMIDGKRDLFFSGAVHYPRSPPELWPKLIQRAKEGGLNTIETYVFWNAHEPEKGKYNFEGRLDLIKYLKVIQDHDMYAVVRIGPFIQAEWNHGGLPYWLREIDRIIFRANNDAYKKEMERFVRFIVQKLKDAELFASQGGPIILTQIPTCNGRHCGDTWTLRDKDKPMLWTENWTAQFRAYGDQVAMRSAEDIAYAVLRFFAKGGSMVNYYMYHGGTNFGRTGASYVLTGYYDEAPMDEYGMCKEPKFGHLRDLHNVIRSYQKAFLTGEHSSEMLGHGYEAHTFELPEDKLCLSFLSNNNTGEDGTVIFRGEKHYVPSRSVSILVGCKNVVYNTKRVFVQHSERSFHTSEVTSKNNLWEMFSEAIPKYHTTKIRAKEPLEQYNQTKDATDYLWYTTSFRLESDDLPFRGDIRPVLQVRSSAHSMIGFANDAFVGSGRGSKQVKGFMFERPVDLKVGVNHITLLSTAMGMKDSGGELAEVKGGIQECLIQGLNTGTLDLQVNGWGHKAALDGEDKEIYSEKGVGKVQWKPAQNDMPTTWYKRYFDEPDGDDIVVLDMSSMSKGMIFVNGEGMGRYWVSYKTLAGTPSQALYHIPRPFLKPKDNLLVVFEEELGKPGGILIQTVTRDDICVLLSEHNPAQIKTWDTDGDKIKLIAEDHNTRGTLTCPPKKTIQEVVFASFGNPEGMCGNFTVGTCHTPNAKQVVEKECLGKPSCVLPVSHTVYGADINCQSTTATLGVQVRCGSEKKGA